MLSRSPQTPSLGGSIAPGIVVTRLARRIAPRRGRSIWWVAHARSKLNTSSGSCCFISTIGAPDAEIQVCQVLNSGCERRKPTNCANAHCAESLLDNCQRQPNDDSVTPKKCDSTHALGFRSCVTFSSVPNGSINSCWSKVVYRYWAPLAYDLLTSF